jgi:hypothetical protein
MPLYYLNTRSKPYEFYCDTADLRSVLNIARPDEFVKFTYFSGIDDLTKRPKIIYQNKVSSELNQLTDWLPADMVWRRILDNHLFAHEFILEFNDGMTAEYKATREVIISFRSLDSVSLILDAFAIHHSAKAALLTEPGSLFQVNQRTGEYAFTGYFKKIRIWLKQDILEAKFKKGFYTSNMN